jgi:hypothetical protein
MTTDNPCLIPNGRAIVFNFPAGAGGKMLQNCVGLSRHCVLNKQEYIAWQLQQSTSPGQDFYEQKLQWVLACVPPSANHMEQWLGFEMDKDDPHGIHLFDFKKRIPVANPGTYRLAQADLWCTLSVHNFSAARYYQPYWPTIQHVCLVNNEKFARSCLPKKNKHSTFDVQWATLGRTPPGIGFEFDVDSCIYDTAAFVQQVQKLYEYLNFDDFNQDYIARYHSRYIEIH